MLAKNVFIKYSNDVKDVDESIEDYRPGKERKLLIAFCDTIADIICNKKIHPIVNELFIKGRKSNINLVFIIQSYLPHNVRLNTTHVFITKISNK